MIPSVVVEKIAHRSPNRVKSTCELAQITISPPKNSDMDHIERKKPSSVPFLCRRTQFDLGGKSFLLHTLCLGATTACVLVATSRSVGKGRYRIFNREAAHIWSGSPGIEMQGGSEVDRRNSRLEDGGVKRRRSDGSSTSESVPGLVERAVDGPRADARGSQGNGRLGHGKEEGQEDPKNTSNMPSDDVVRPGKRMKSEEGLPDPGIRGKGDSHHAHVASDGTDDACSRPTEAAHGKGAGRPVQRQLQDSPAAVMSTYTELSGHASNVSGLAGGHDGGRATDTSRVADNANGAAGATGKLNSSGVMVKEENADGYSFGSALMTSSSASTPTAIFAKSAVEALLGTGSGSSGFSRSVPASRGSNSRSSPGVRPVAYQDDKDGMGVGDMTGTSSRSSRACSSLGVVQSGVPGLHDHAVSASMCTDWLSIIPAAPKHLPRTVLEGKRRDVNKSRQPRCGTEWLRQVHGVEAPIAESCVVDGAYNRRSSAFWKCADTKQDAALREIAVLLRTVIAQDTSRIFSSGDHQQHSTNAEARAARVDLTWVLKGIRQGVYRRPMYSTQQPTELCANDVESVWMECARKHARGSPELMRALELRIVFAQGLHKILESVSLPPWRGMAGPISLKYHTEQTTLCLHGMGGVVQAAYTQLWQAGHKGTLHHGGFATVYCGDMERMGKARSVVQFMVSEVESEAQEALQLLQSASAAMFLPALSAMNLVPPSPQHQHQQQAVMPSPHQQSHHHENTVSMCVCGVCVDS